MTRFGIMMKRSGAGSIACWIGIALLGLPIGFVPSAARAHSADLVLWDRLAAHALAPARVVCDRRAPVPPAREKPADVRGARDIASSKITTAIKYCRVA